MAAILADVQQRGDAAVLEYTRRFDGLDGGVDGGARDPAESNCRRRSTAIPPAQRERAGSRRRSACAATTSARLEACGRSWSYRDADGTLLGQKVTPLDRVGIYVPGGKAAYPSAVLMNAMPAQVAGVGEIIMVVPTPGSTARPPAMASATRWCWPPPRWPAWTASSPSAARRPWPRWPTARPRIPAVDKITGPGNAYVASAKRRVFGTVGIDMIAGPSEILVLADGSTPPDWVAMDLFSQAEHDELAQSILLCPDAGYIDRGAAGDRPAAAGDAAPRRDPRVARRPRRADPHAHAWKRPARSATASRPSTWSEFSRDPHRWEPLLQACRRDLPRRLHQREPGRLLRRPEPRAAHLAAPRAFSSPLGVYDFQKRSSLIEVSEAGAQALGPIAAELAHGEGLQAHARAAEMRLRH